MIVIGDNEVIFTEATIGNEKSELKVTESDKQTKSDVTNGRNKIVDIHTSSRPALRRSDREMQNPKLF